MKLVLKLNDGQAIIQNIDDNLTSLGNTNIFTILKECFQTDSPVRLKDMNGKVTYESEFKDVYSVEIILK